nr:immunoglobulin heavy chain junction region [Mus musculus]
CTGHVSPYWYFDVW